MHPSADAIPFAMGFLATLVQPLMDKVWLSQYEKNYNAEDQALVGGAKWIADVAAFLPTALLTVFGTFLIFDTASDDQRPWLIGVAAVLTVASGGLYLLAVYHRRPERDSWGPYSLLQYWLMLLNVIGALTACILK